MPAPENEADGKNILVVDDKPENLELLTGMLRDQGYKIRMALSGELALQAARNAPPDLILLDINMPGLDGYEVCARLKADAKLGEVPVIFLSSLNETGDKMKAFSAGGVDYITKPFHFEEVTARVQAQLKLREQKLALEENCRKLLETEKMRDSLVHMMVHDLRSPLSAMYSLLGFIEKETREHLSADAAEDLAEARRAAEKMARMVSNMLDASKLEAGKMKLSLEVFDLRELAREVAEGLRPLAGKRRVILEGGDGPVPVRADRALAERVLQNLLANALRFAPSEGGLVRLALARAGTGARLSVENNGPAIPAEYQVKIFEKFGQVETGAASRGYSTGLGLNFCKLAVEAHGGRIGVSSEQGGTTVFWFELPAAARPEPARASETVLVVDDEEVIRGEIARILSAEGYRVLEAGDADEALALCAAHKEGIGLLLTDIVMPRITGNELYESVAGLCPGAGVAYMSGHSGEILREARFLTGAEVLLRKPFTAAALLDTVREALAARGKRPAKAAA